jgi:hypothetical protein
VIIPLWRGRISSLGRDVKKAEWIDQKAYRGGIFDRSAAQMPEAGPSPEELSPEAGSTPGSVSGFIFP